MERERLGNGRYRVFLSDEELQDWGLSFERLSMRSPCTRALLSAILVAASEGEPLCADGMTAEVFPVEGGCFLLFSGESAAETLHAEGLPLCASFSEIDELCSFCGALMPLPFSASRLYTYDARWWLVLYPQPESIAQVAALLSEWECEGKHGETAAAFLEEHGTLLCGENALERVHETG